METKTKIKVFIGVWVFALFYSIVQLYDSILDLKYFGIFLYVLMLCISLYFIDWNYRKYRDLNLTWNERKDGL